MTQVWEIQGKFPRDNFFLFFFFPLKEHLTNNGEVARELSKSPPLLQLFTSCLSLSASAAASPVPRRVPARSFQDATAISSVCVDVFTPRWTMCTLVGEGLILSCAVNVPLVTICFLGSTGAVFQKTITVILRRFFLINEQEFSTESLNESEQCKKWI